MDGLQLQPLLPNEGQNNEIHDAVAVDEPADGDVHHPAMWAISYQQLLDIERLAIVRFGWGYRFQSMHEIVASVTSPLQKVRDGVTRSYALTLNPDGLRVGAFVTHCWDECFADFVDSIRREFRNTFPRPNLWICGFALRQGDPQDIQNQIGNNLDECPFVRALWFAKRFVVVRNSQTDLYSRIWCVCELMKAHQYGFSDTNNQGNRDTLVIGPINFSHRNESCLFARAYHEEDRRQILATLLLQFNVDYIDRLIRQYRKHDARERDRAGGPKTLVFFQFVILCFLLIRLLIGGGVDDGGDDAVMGRETSSCSINPICRHLGLEGECCPTNDGVNLNCCSREKECSAHSACSHLEGDCCPTEVDNLFLDCCYDLGADTRETLEGVLDLNNRDINATTGIDFGYTKLYGSIPTKIGLLTNLEKLKLWNNRLTGTLPSQMGLLTALTHLELHFNELSGPIPTQLGRLTALKELFVDHNTLEGRIPRQLAKLTQVKYMGLGSNTLSGSIPSQFGRLTTLQSLWLGHNQLTGLIPTEIAKLTELRGDLALDHNQLSGPIPPGLSTLTNLSEIHLHYNELTGTVPPELLLLSSLQVLNLFNNSLSGQASIDICSGAAFDVYTHLCSPGTSCGESDTQGFPCGGKCNCWDPMA